MRRWTFFLVAGALLTACAAQTPPPATATVTPSPQPGQLTPYHSPAAAGHTPTPANLTPSPLPSPTPTPQRHVVQQGEDMFGIAFRYGIGWDELMTANPSVDPRLMSVGMELVIPYSDRPTPTALNPTPTALPLEIGQPACYPNRDGSLTCLAPVFNGTGTAVENLSGKFRLKVAQSGELQESLAYPPLNLLRPGESLPLVAVLAAPAPRVEQASAELDTALSVADGDARYLSAELTGVSVDIREDGLSAQVAGQVTLDAGAVSPAGTAWVLAVAYDDSGRVIGYRRWENVNTLSAGDSVDFQLIVYSLAGEINRVETLVEVRP